MKHRQRIELRSRHADVILSILLSILSILRPAKNQHSAVSAKGERTVICSVRVRLRIL